VVNDLSEMVVVLARAESGWLNGPMPETVGGIPLHPLVVHAVVVLVPLVALGVLTMALVPRWRTRFGSLVLATAVVVTALVPVATQSGEQLEESRPESDLIERHAELGDSVLFGAVPLLVLAVALWWLGRRAERGAPVPGWLNVLVTVLSVVVAIAATVQMVLVGHSGAEAVWGS
jgi:uncharacterized membrane protein